MATTLALTITLRPAAPEQPSAGNDSDDSTVQRAPTPARNRPLVATPAPGKSGVFRINLRRALPEGVAKDDPDAPLYVLVKSPNRAGWRTDLPFSAPQGSPLGQELISGLGWDVGHTATVVLAWNRSDPPAIEVTELVCWEYFGVGTDTRIGISGGPLSARPSPPDGPEK